ncbi:ESCRT-II complex subunit-domain-containing protein [Triangularia verruculosa]|uniref:Vacuolar protein-sorting-associated protein 25 n=1 Tax=Triangularia verruculosa TaxID=2587418 RepID=A0AAN6XFN8_9PEZI|nr:ESCRT-II complex subunit-domain-containing protein [Triangularia verruculosa]
MPTPPTPPFPFPKEYSFPPFFTPQINLATRHAQLTKWSSLILSYCRHHAIYRLSLSDTTTSPSSPAYPLFNNDSINRRLSLSYIKEIIDFMRRDGRAEWVSGSGSGEQQQGDLVWVYWRTPEEWAGLVEKWVEETGNKGQVMTVYELVEGEGSRGSEFWGLDQELMVKAVQVLVKKGKAQTMGGEENLGVKFF